MGAIKVTFVQPDGVEKTIIDGGVGESLMELATANGIVGILGNCGGSCACATCHVYVDPAWMSVVGNADAGEDATLDGVADSKKLNSRLCCQIRLTEEMAGLKMVVAPSE